MSREERDEVARRFLDAWETGDTDALVEVLAPDVTLYGDGGGKAPAIPEPLVGAVRVAKALIGWGPGMLAERGYTYRRATVNGEPGVVFYDPTGAWRASRCSRSPTASSSPCGRCSTPTSSRTSPRAEPLASVERRDQRLGDDLERPAGDLARLAEPRERVLLGQALALHQQPLRPLDRLRAASASASDAASSRSAVSSSWRARAVSIAGSRSDSRNGFTR